MEFKDALKALRHKANLSQLELSKKLGFSPALIGMYESGKRMPSYEALETIADFFNVSTDYLTGRDDKSTYYLDPEAAQIAQEIYDNPDLRILFDASRKVSKEDLQLVVDMVNRFKKEDDLID